MTVPTWVLRAFGAEGPALALLDHAAVYRAGNLILKKLSDTSLESDRSLELAVWLADVTSGIEEPSFRLARPARAADGRWQLEGGWMAWHYVRGTAAKPADVQLLIPAIIALHASLSHVAKHPALDVNTSAWGRAHRDCWSRRPDDIEPAVAPLADALYARLQPLPSLPLQLIHGDLNPGNMVVSSQEAPGFIDFTPFWAPAGFALAIFANWLGPRRADISVLSAFSAQPFFTQLLLRASIRMLLVVSNLGGTGSWDPERRAAELVLEYVSRDS